MSENFQGADVSQLLAQRAQGDRAALDVATQIVYAELRKIADGYLRRERGNHNFPWRWW